MSTENDYFKLQGKVINIAELQTFDSGFTKREFVIETNEKYPQQIKFELTRDRTEKLNNVSEGDMVEVRFNVLGNEWKDRWYVNLNAWYLKKLEGTDSSEEPAPETQEDIQEGMPF